jgi:hypothetical protein
LGPLGFFFDLRDDFKSGLSFTYNFFSDATKYYTESITLEEELVLLFIRISDIYFLCLSSILSYPAYYLFDLGETIGEGIGEGTLPSPRFSGLSLLLSKGISILGTSISFGIKFIAPGGNTLINKVLFRCEFTLRTGHVSSYFTF